MHRVVIGADLPKLEIRDIRDEPRWQADARRFGESGANHLAFKRALSNEHYTGIKEDERRRRRWRQYLEDGSVDDLISTARDLFELIEEETKGVIEFIPGTRVWSEGAYTFVDISGKGKKGCVVSWQVKGSESLTRKLHLSSDVETEIWRRLTFANEPVNLPLKVFGANVGLEQLNKYFGDFYGEYHRNFGSMYNHMPMRVESAFNHMPEVGRPIKVKGFAYPHPKLPDMVF